jgi:hypothetical protein
MKISENTAEIISDIKKFSGSKLKNEQDISVLIEAAFEKDKKKLFNDLVFTAKYLNGLGKILHSNNSNSPASAEPKIDSGKIDENAEEKIRNEFKQNMLKLSSQISDIIINIPAEDKKSFENKYLAMNRTSLVNLTNLIYDLSWVKKYLNSRKS